MRPVAREVRELLALAWPLVVSHLTVTGMNTVDTLMVAPLGATPLAAMAVAFAVHISALMVCTGIILGMTPLVSQAFGAGGRRECRRVLVQGLWLALMLSVPMIVLSLVGRPLALLLGQAPAVAELADGYLRALAWGIPPILLFMAFRQFLEGMGITRPTMWILLVGFVANIFGNWWLIYGLGSLIEPMGVVGSGLATSVTRWCMLGALGVFVLVTPGLRPFTAVRLAPRARRLVRVVRIGLPIGAQLGLEVGLFSFAAIMVGWFGPVALAAHQITINIASTTFMVGLGTGLAGTIRVGQHIGARRPNDARSAAIGTYAVVVGFMAVCAAAFVAFPGVLLGLYTDDAAILRIGTGLLLIAGAFQVFDGAQAAGMCVLRGAADTRIPMYIAGFGYWLVGMPVGYVLAFHTDLGPSGIWVGLCLGLATVAVFLLRRVRRVLWDDDLVPESVAAARSA